MGCTAWADLPNAKHIDAVLADVKRRPEVWAEAWGAAGCAAGGAVWDTAWDTAWGAARAAARAAVWDAVWGAARDVERDAAWGAARAAAWDGLCALIAWDNAADLLALTPDALRTIIDTCDGDVRHQAVLLLPAVIARGTM